MWEKKNSNLEKFGPKTKEMSVIRKSLSSQIRVGREPEAAGETTPSPHPIHTERNRDKLTTPHLLKKIKPGNSYLFENGYNVTRKWFINIHEYRLRGQRKIKWRILTLKTVPRGLPWAWRVLGKNSTFQKENQGLVRRGWWRRRLPRTPFSCLFMY